jgi:hypothetical protein
MPAYGPESRSSVSISRRLVRRLPIRGIRMRSNHPAVPPRVPRPSAYQPIALTHLILLAMASVLHAQVPDLTAEERRVFERSKLSVEVSGAAALAYQPELGVGSVSTWRKWQGIHGFNRITEEQFFRIAGFEHEATRAAEYRRDSHLMVAGGLAALIVGGALIISGIEQDTAAGPYFLGTILFAGGTGIGIYGGFRLERNWAPYASVRDGADQYNATLIQEIVRARTDDE